MNMVSIQGTYARSYFLKEAELLGYHSILHSVLDHQYLLIHSKFKTDLLYKASEDLNDFFVEKFLKHQEKNQDDPIGKRFYTSTGIKDTLEAYFIRLYHFKQRKDWFLPYSNAVKRELHSNQGNPIAAHLIKCCEQINLNAFDSFNTVEPSSTEKNSLSRQEAYFKLMSHIDRLNFN